MVAASDDMKLDVMKIGSIYRYVKKQIIAYNGEGYKHSNGNSGDEKLVFIHFIFSLLD